MPVLMLFAIVATACGDDGGGSPPSTSGATSTTASVPTTTVPTTSAPRPQASVRVYFTLGEKVGTAGRSVEAIAFARGAMEALLEGPDELEAGIGMGSEIPEGTELLDIALADDRATVDLSGSFESGGGSLSMQLRVAQVVFTLTQFDRIESVTILLDGRSVGAIGGEGVPATDLTRADFENVTPFILVESPVPGETVSSPFDASGIANTFEANVRYEVTDAAGEVLDEGFTTATAGTGVWGDFSFTVHLGSAPAGAGQMVVWQDDAETGERADVYEVPIQFG